MSSISIIVLESYFLHFIIYLNISCSDCRAVLIKDNDNVPSPEDDFTSIFGNESDMKQGNSDQNTSSDDFKQYDSLLQKFRVEKLSSKSPKKKETVAKGIFLYFFQDNNLILTSSLSFNEELFNTLVLS